MKKYLLAALLLLAVTTAFAQDGDAPINRDWKIYATDTALTRCSGC